MNPKETTYAIDLIVVEYDAHKNEVGRTTHKKIVSKASWSRIFTFLSSIPESGYYWQYTTFNPLAWRQDQDNRSTVWSIYQEWE